MSNEPIELSSDRAHLATKTLLERIRQFRLSQEMIAIIVVGAALAALMLHLQSEFLEDSQAARAAWAAEQAAWAAERTAAQSQTDPGAD